MNRIHTILSCGLSKIKAKVRDFTLSRDANEYPYNPATPEVWRSFWPGHKRIEVTIIGGRKMLKDLKQDKDKERDWSIHFPDGDRFRFKGKMSKIKSRRAGLFSKHISITVDIADESMAEPEEPELDYMPNINLFIDIKKITQNMEAACKRAIEQINAYLKKQG